MQHLIDTILEKHAGKMGDWFKNLGPVKKYNAIKASPSFKAKKWAGRAIAGTALVGAPAVYGIHKLTAPPERTPDLQPQQQLPPAPVY